MQEAIFLHGKQRLSDDGVVVGGGLAGSRVRGLIVGTVTILPTIENDGAIIISTNI